ncbi:MAG: nitroreductase family protein [Deltaproteobacteria bacterium]|nr:nitroreductase family protein [Deltaproteobacteria bacterium]MBI2210724.1 nitroreductase family protein [Deltaproteobacteria bacterium]MBI2348439.1 nitroreductase family protein [Deltaproteobacteria bacterium]MBI2538851.1 nitroreductase family protein [Deltaproteobacteria bacterium]MBI2990744.1 nitroreductase family protein [Deltaproteobacteria bacterium]
MNSAGLLQVIKKRRSVRVYKAGKVADKQLETILEAGRWAPSGANTQPWEFVVTRDRGKMKKVRRIYDNEWKERKKEDPIHYKGLKKDYVGDVSVLVLVCGDPRTKQVYLTTRQPGDREKLFQASIANAVEHMMLMAASMGLGTVWVSVREEVEPELRELFKVPQPLRLLWVVPIGHAKSWPKAKPRRKISDFAHRELCNPKKLRQDSAIRPWPKS